MSNKEIVGWLLGTVTAVALAYFSLSSSRADSGSDRLEARISIIEQARIPEAEARGRIEGKVDGLAGRLSAIESKLDVALAKGK